MNAIPVTAERPLAGRVALVTGSTSGIGWGIASALAEAGADVALLDRSPASETAARIGALGRRVHAIELDLLTATPGDLHAAVSSVAEALGGLDILVNNAGMIRRAPL